MANLIKGFREKLINHDLPGLRFIVDSFNFYDKKRVNEIGPDRACAEWIVRCEGKIKFDKYKDFIHDYNFLVYVTSQIDPTKPGQQLHLTHIDATDAFISGYGSYHFNGLKHLEDAKFVRCKNWPDWGFNIMETAVGNQLKSLHIEDCRKISEHGIQHLKNFKALKKLTIQGIEVKNKDQLAEELKSALPSCEVKIS